MTNSERSTLDQIRAAGCARKGFCRDWHVNGWNGSGPTRWGPTRRMIHRLIESGALVYDDSLLNKTQLDNCWSAVRPPEARCDGLASVPRSPIRDV